MKGLFFLFSATIFLSSCAAINEGAMSPQDQSCIASEKAAAAWNSLSVDQFGSALAAQDPATRRQWAKAGYTKKQIQRGFLERTRNNLHQCQQAMFKRRVPIDLPESSTMIDRIDDRYKSEDAAAFKKLTGGKQLCEQDMTSFTSNMYGEPAKNCVYPYTGGKLTVLSSTGAGVLVQGPFHSIAEMGARPVFIYKNIIDSNRADDSYIADGLFSFEGVVSYPSVFGQRSVYAFRRIQLPNK